MVLSFMSRSGPRVALFGLLALPWLAGSAAASISLEFRPAAQTVPIGSLVQVGLYAVGDGVTQPFGAIDLMVDWDPTYLGLTGVNQAGAASLLYSGFPAGDLWGINEAAPPTDGDGYYLAQAPLFGSGVNATPAGTLVTTLEFIATALTPGVLLDMLPQAGSPSYPTTVWDGVAANNPVTGGLDSALVTIVPEPASLLALLGMVGLLRRR